MADLPNPSGPPVDVLRQDEYGVDLAQLEYNLTLTPAQRLEQHYRVRGFVVALRAEARRRYGSAVDSAEEAGRRWD